MKLQRSYHKEVQQIAAHCGIEGSVPLSPQRVQREIVELFFCVKARDLYSFDGLEALLFVFL